MKKIRNIFLVCFSFAIVIFLIYFFFGGTASGPDGFFDINRILLWFCFYILCLITGVFIRFYHEGDEFTPQEKKEFENWKKNNEKNNSDFSDRIKLKDKLLYKYGHPFDVSIWDFEKGFVSWLLGAFFQGFAIWAVIIIIVFIPISIYIHYF